MNYREHLLEASRINTPLLSVLASFQAVGLKTAYSLTSLSNKRDASWRGRPPFAMIYVLRERFVWGGGGGGG
ncbi:MAG: hypothetical protein LBK00_10840, partial [Treponema sp.]|nr:hypothetical protein [Treponema sp.]